MILTIDIGGTFTKIALYSRGKLKNITKRPTNEKRDLTIREIYDYYNKLDNKTKKQIKGVSISIAGLLDGQTLKFAPSLGWKNYKIGSIVSNLFKLKTTVINDANAFVLAEHHFGLAKKYKNVVGLTLGTGIGGGIIINNELYTGKGNAGEIGHMIIRAFGNKCDCGSYGCFSAYVSGRAIERSYERETGHKNTAENIFKLNSKSTHKILEEATRYLAMGLSNVSNILDPDIIVIGGSIKKNRRFIANAKKQMKLYALNDTKIVISELDYPELLGAGLFFEETNKKK